MIKSPPEKNTIGHIIIDTGLTESIIFEASIKNGILEIYAIIQDLERTNRNGRYYSLVNMERAMTQDIRFKELMATQNLFGEAGHPRGADINRQREIDQGNMSHVFKKIWIDGNDVKAIVAPSGTLVGKDFEGVIRNGTRPSFSLRAIGRLKQTSNGNEVQNMMIITWDWVIFPSHSRAYMQNINAVTESGIYVPEHVLKENRDSNKLYLEEDDKGYVHEITSTEVTDAINESTDFKEVLKSLSSVCEKYVVKKNGREIDLYTESGIITIDKEEYISSEIINYCSKKSRY